MNHVVWFDIPVIDLQRAMGFYAAVLGVDVVEEFPNVSVIAHDTDAVSGCLFQGEEAVPSEHGPLLYFNVNGRLEEAVLLAERHGGVIRQAPQPIGEFGQRAIVLDSEGNRIALHSG